MLAKNFTLLFYLKKRSNYVSGTLPVYMRISVNGTRSEMSMGRDCDPEKWNTVSGRKTGTKSDTKEPVIENKSNNGLYEVSWYDKSGHWKK